MRRREVVGVLGAGGLAVEEALDVHGAGLDVGGEVRVAHRRLGPLDDHPHSVVPVGMHHGDSAEGGVVFRRRWVCRIPSGGTGAFTFGSEEPERRHGW